MLVGGKIMKVNGNCLCGHITYEAEINPESVVVCHCTDCQTHTGSAFSVAVGIVNDEFRLLTGELKSYEKVADSGTIRALAFCPECGNRIHAKTVGEGSSFFGLRVGTVRQRDKLKPKAQSWCRSAQDWVNDLNSIPRFDTRRPRAE
jgi:hypothetical protein